MMVLGLIVALGLVLGTWQAWSSDAGLPRTERFLADRSAALTYPHRVPPSWYDGGSFLDTRAQVVRTSGLVALDPALVKGDHTSQTVTVPPGSGPVASNIAAGTELVTVHGLPVVGRTADGYLAFGRPPGGGGRVRVTVAASGGAAIVGGRVLTWLGLLCLLAALVVPAALRRHRARHNAERAAGHPDAVALWLSRLSGSSRP